VTEVHWRRNAVRRNRDLYLPGLLVPGIATERGTRNVEAGRIRGYKLRPRLCIPDLLSATEPRLGVDLCSRERSTVFLKWVNSGTLITHARRHHVTRKDGAVGGRSGLRG
jgi:hypothetical protein